MSERIKNCDTNTLHDHKINGDTLQNQGKIKPKGFFGPSINPQKNVIEYQKRLVTKIKNASFE